MSETFGKDANLLADNGELGEVKISDAAIMAIAGIAATEVEGVDASAVKNISKNVKIEVEDNKVFVEISLAIKNSYRILEVSEKVQEKIKASVESMTGLSVPEVKVRITGVSIPES